MARAAATLLVIAAALGLWYAWYAYAARCDDSCAGSRYTAPPAGEPWDDYQSSWQWTAQFVLAATGLVLTACARLAVRWGRGRVATALLALTVAVFVCWAALLAGSRFPVV